MQRCLSSSFAVVGSCSMWVAMAHAGRRHCAAATCLATTELAQRVVDVCGRGPTRSVELSVLAEMLRWKDMEKGQLYPKSLKKYVLTLSGIVELVEDLDDDRTTTTRSAVVVLPRKASVVGVLREEDVVAAVEVIEHLRALEADSAEGGADGECLSVASLAIPKDVLIRVSVLLPSELSVAVPTVGNPPSPATVRLGPRQRAQSLLLQRHRRRALLDPPVAASAASNAAADGDDDVYRNVFAVDCVIPLLQQLKAWMHAIGIATLERLLAWPAWAAPVPGTRPTPPPLLETYLRNVLQIAGRGGDGRDGRDGPGASWRFSADGRVLEFATTTTATMGGPSLPSQGIAPPRSSSNRIQTACGGDTFLQCAAAGAAEGPTEALRLVHLIVRLVLGDCIPLLERGPKRIQVLAERLRWTQYRYHMGSLYDFIAHFDGVFFHALPTDGGDVAGAPTALVAAASAANVTFPLLFARLMLPFMAGGGGGGGDGPAMPLPLWYQAMDWSRWFQPRFGLLQDCLRSVGCRVEQSHNAADGGLLMVSLAADRDMEDDGIRKDEHDLDERCGRRVSEAPTRRCCAAALDHAIQQGKRKQLCLLLASVDEQSARCGYDSLVP